MNELIVKSGLIVSGSINATNGVTASLFGTASYVTASGVIGTVLSSSFAKNCVSASNGFNVIGDLYCTGSGFYHLKTSNNQVADFTSTAGSYQFIQINDINGNFYQFGVNGNGGDLNSYNYANNGLDIYTYGNLIYQFGNGTVTAVGDTVFNGISTFNSQLTPVGGLWDSANGIQAISLSDDHFLADVLGNPILSFNGNGNPIDIVGGLRASDFISGSALALRYDGIFTGKIFPTFGGGSYALNQNVGTDQNLTLQPHITLTDGIAFASVNDANTANQMMEFRASKYYFWSAQITTDGNLGVGLGTTTPSAKLHTQATTEQLRVAYNSSNYYKTTVASNGSTTFDAIGTSPTFTFGDPVNVVGNISCSVATASIFYGTSSILQSVTSPISQSLSIGSFGQMNGTISASNLLLTATNNSTGAAGNISITAGTSALGPGGGVTITAGTGTPNGIIRLIGQTNITGQLNVINTISCSAITASQFNGTSSYANTASFVKNSQSASYISSSGVVGTVTSSSYSITSSFLDNTIFTKQYASLLTTTTSSIDWNTGNVQYLVANGQTLTLSNPVGGGRYILVVKQPAAGTGSIVTFPAAVLWSGGTAPTFTTTNNKVDMISLIYDNINSKYYGNFSLNF